MRTGGLTPQVDRPPEPVEQKGPSRRKRGGRSPLKIALIVLAVVAVINAIGSRSPSDKPDEPGRSPAAPSQTERQEAAGVPSGDQAVPEAPEVPSVPGVGDLGDYHVEIKGAVLTEDYQGNPSIVVTYSWTNNSEKTTSAMVALDGDAFQDGIGLETAITMNSDVHDGSAYMTEIRPGASLDVTLAYVLKNTTSVVEFELSELISFSNDIVPMTFDPNTLQAG